MTVHTPIYLISVSGELGPLGTDWTVKNQGKRPNGHTKFKTVLLVQAAPIRGGEPMVTPYLLDPDSKGEPLILYPNLAVRRELKNKNRDASQKSKDKRRKIDEAKAMESQNLETQSNATDRLESNAAGCSFINSLDDGDIAATVELIASGGGMVFKFFAKTDL